MGLRDWIINSEQVATATPATFATLTIKNKQTVATVATVIVASSEKTEKTAMDAPTPKKGRVAGIPLNGGTDQGKDHISDVTNGNKKDLPSPAALTWLKDHRDALRRNGWTMAELYRRNKSKGIAWVAFWDKPFLKVYLQPGGVIEFECIINGRDIIQTARPMTQQPEKTKGENPK